MQKNEKLKNFMYSDNLGKSSKHDISIELVDLEVRYGFYSVGGKNIAPKGTIRRNKKKI